MSQLDFKTLFVQFELNENSAYVKRRKDLLSNKLSYLNEFNVTVGKESVLDVFEEVTEIGNGTFGEVFRVRDKNGSEFAFKRIRLRGNKENDLKLMREVLISKQLNHENIVNFIEYWIEFDGTDMPSIILFMELCQESLHDWMWRKNQHEFYNYVEGMLIFHDICSGIRYLHSKNFIHRDLKPGNIIIDHKGVCKIGDFGLSKFHESNNDSNEMLHSIQLGTPLYSAPEQLIYGDYDFKVDIYSLGCILMEFFMHLPIYDHLIQVLTNIEAKHQLPNLFTTKFIDEASLILDMTENNPDKRPKIDHVIGRFGNITNNVSYLFNHNLVVSNNFYDKDFMNKANKHGIVRSIGENKITFKILNLIGDEKLITSYLEEFETIRKLNHSNIVKLLDICFHYQTSLKFTVFIKIEQVEESLKDWLLRNKNRRNRLSIDSEDWNIYEKAFLDISNGLEYFHSKTLIHGDLKPPEIFISPDGTSKIMPNNKWKRFVYYKNEQDYFKSFEEQGIVNYAAPEQMVEDESKSYTSSTDIFSFGCILIEFFMEFDDEKSLMSALKTLRNNQVVPTELKQFDLQFFSLISDMTLRDYSKRPAISLINKKIRECFQNCRLKIEAKMQLNDKDKTGKVINFTQLFPKILRQKSDIHVIRRTGIIENELSYLKEYQVSTTNKSVMDIFGSMELIGSGGFGEVNKVEKEGIEFALKRVKMSKNKNRDMQILREVNIGLKLSHENIVNIHEYWIEFDNVDWLWINIFMELCRESLSNWLRRRHNKKGVSYFKSMKMMHDICEGLRYIHNEGFIHRDLKPANILIDSKGVCKVADFGLATAQDSGLHTDKIATKVYTAPEQINQKNYGPKVDIYSLGCIFIHFFAFLKEKSKHKTGKKSNIIEITLEQMRNGRLPDFFNSAYLEEAKLIRQMILSDPNERPNIVQVMGELSQIAMKMLYLENHNLVITNHFYEKIFQNGRGEFGLVKMTAKNRYKIYKIEINGMEIVFKKALDELKYFMEFKHEYILRIEEYSVRYQTTNSMKLLILMELCDESLEKWLTNNPLENRFKTEENIQILFNFFIDICKGLKYIHDTKKTHHGNLNPSEILISPISQVCKIVMHIPSLKLLKFENQQMYFQEMDNREKPNFCSPESYQENSMSEISSSTDIYSFGCILFGCLNGNETNQQLVLALKNRRNNNTIIENPSDFSNKYGDKLMELINSSTLFNLKDRPNIDEVQIALKSGFEYFIGAKINLKSNMKLVESSKNREVATINNNLVEELKTIENTPIDREDNHEKKVSQLDVEPIKEKLSITKNELVKPPKPTTKPAIQQRRTIFNKPELEESEIQPKRTQLRKAIAIECMNDANITFIKGDLITIFEEKNGKLFGEMNGKSGWFDKKYVKNETKNESDSSSAKEEFSTQDSGIFESLNFQQTIEKLLLGDLSHLKEFENLMEKNSYIDDIKEGIFKYSIKEKNIEENFWVKKSKLIGKKDEMVKLMRANMDCLHIQNENLIKYLECSIKFDIDMKPWIELRMEFWYGNLADWIEQKNKLGFLSYPSVLKSISDVCSGLAYLHEKKIVHGSLNTQNIVHHGDWRISGHFTTNFDVLQVENTEMLPLDKLYLAPEQLLGENMNEKQDNKVDIFSLGLILNQYFVNFGDEISLRTSMELIRNKHELPLIFNDRYEIEKKLISKMTSKKPESRPDINQVKSQFQSKIREIGFLKDYQISILNSVFKDKCQDFNDFIGCRTNSFSFHGKLIDLIGSKDILSKTLQKLKLYSLHEHENIVNQQNFLILYTGVELSLTHYLLFIPIGWRNITLKDWFSKHSSSDQNDIKKFVKLFSDVCDGLSYLNSKFIFHGDLKPSEIIISPKGVAKVLKSDFCPGLLEFKSDREYFMSFDKIGFENYASPEMMGMSSHPISSSTDIFSLGCIIIEFFIGSELHRVQKAKIYQKIRLKGFSKEDFLLYSKSENIYDLMTSMTSRSPTLRPALKKANDWLKFTTSKHEFRKLLKRE